MQKAILHISLIICTNLLAFLSVWLILDAIFKTDWVYTLICVVLSLPVLGLIMYMKAGIILQKLHDISLLHDDEQHHIR